MADEVDTSVVTSSTECNKGESDSGKANLGSIFNVLALAVAGYSTAAAISTAQQQYEIAKDYLEIAEWWRDYYNTVFAPWENIELEEVLALVDEEPEYDITIGRTRTAGRIRFKGMDYQAIRCTSEYCTGLRGALLKDAAVAEATAVAALSNLGWQNEKAWVEARNDLRWKKILAVINRGRDMIAENVRFSNLAFGIFGDLTKQAGDAASGAIGYLGYNLYRRETRYPALASQLVERAVPTRGVESAPVAATSPTVTSGVLRDPSTGELRAATEAELR